MSGRNNNVGSENERDSQTRRSTGGPSVQGPRSSLTSSLRQTSRTKPKSGAYEEPAASPTTAGPPSTFEEGPLKRASTQIITSTTAVLPTSGASAANGNGNGSNAAREKETVVLSGASTPPRGKKSGKREGNNYPASSFKDWGTFFRDGVGFNETEAARYEAIFLKEEMPLPGADLCHCGIDNDLLISCGINLAGHRARILTECRKTVFCGNAGHAHGPQGPLTGSDDMNEKFEELAPGRSLPVLYGFDDVDEVRSDVTEESITEIEDPSTVFGYTDIPSVGRQGALLNETIVNQTVKKGGKRSGKGQPFVWVDLCGRDKERTDYKEHLLEVAEKYQFSDSLLADIDLTLALPQVITSPEQPNQYLIILRVATEATDIEEDSLHLLTNRWMIAVNLNNHTIVTIHRADSVSIAALRSSFDNTEWTFSQFLCKFLDDSLLAYIDALHESEFLLDQYESVMLKHSVGAQVETHQRHHIPRATLESIGDPSKLTRQRMNQLLYHLHRRCSVYSRMLSLMQGALETAFASLNLCSPEYAEQMSRSCGELAVKAESLHDNCQNLLNLHLSLVSFRTNELMGILTTFSAFFIPLTFVCGVYGMNFDNMPELHIYYGYYYCLGGMALIVIGVWIFFRQKGLL